jgi:putative heme iron utilization protein
MVEQSKALILTHPFQRFNADEEEIINYLENQNKYDEIFYVSQSCGRIPVPVKTLDSQTNRRSRLPPGFDEGFYEKGLKDNCHGWIQDEDIEDIILEYNEIGLGGASGEACVRNSFKSIESRLEDLDTDLELYFEEQITYT